MALDRPLPARASAVTSRAWRGGNALQRPAEAHILARDLRAAAADGADRHGYVAAPGFAAAGLGRPVRRPPIGAYGALHRRLAAGAVRSSACIRSDRDGLLEQPALDDHR